MFHPQQKMPYVMVRPWKADDYLKIGNWSVFVMFGCGFRIRDNYEMGRVRAFPIQMPSRLEEIIKLLLSWYFRASRQ